MVTAGQSFTLFDRSRLRQLRARRLQSDKAYGFLRRWALEQILDRLGDIKRGFGLCLAEGLRRNADLKALLQNHRQIENLLTMDFTPGEATDICGDGEYLPIKNASLDCLISLLELHALNDLPGALIQMRRSLKPDGLLMGAFFGGETLFELRQSLTASEINLRGGLSPRVFPFASKQDAGALMQRAGYALPVIDSEIVKVTYENMTSLMHDLRGMAETNALAGRDKTYAGKAFFENAAQYYADRFTNDQGRIVASFEIIFALGWAPHESQPQPLKPGSARIKLSDALE